MGRGAAPQADYIADPRILSWWTETDLRTNCLHQSDAPLGLTWIFGLLTCAHTAWKSTSASLFFRASGKETVENLKISPGQLAPCQEKRIKRQQTLTAAGCKVLEPNAGFLLASMHSYCRYRPIEFSYSQSVSVSVPQDKIRGSAIVGPRQRKMFDRVTRDRATLRTIFPVAVTWSMDYSIGLNVVRNIAAVMDAK